MPVRRLTAILAADVAGYSRLMGADEEGTHERLKGHFRELVNPKIEAGQPQYRCAAGRWSWAGGLDGWRRREPREGRQIRGSARASHRSHSRRWDHVP